MHASVRAGTGFDVLVRAAAVADEQWREVFAGGRATYRRAVGTGGSALVRDCRRLGRFGFLNLATLLADGPAPWSLDVLAELVRASDPPDLHLLVVGAGRRQLQDAVGGDRLQAALTGDRAALRELRSALASDRLVVGATPWVLRTPSIEVKRTLLAVLRSWSKVLPEQEEQRLAASLRTAAKEGRRRLAELGPRAALDEITCGIHYDPPGLDRVVLVPSPSVAPVLVFVDGVRRAVVLHPPVPDGTGAGPAPQRADRLALLARALGDETRLRLLAALRSGPTTAVALADRLGAPRTTLLHHLALLRSAGFLDVDVTPGDATVYTLRVAGFRELAQASDDFVG